MNNEDIDSLTKKISLGVLCDADDEVAWAFKKSLAYKT